MLIDLVIVGAGPAGLMAGIQAKEQQPNLEVVVCEAKGQVGGKLSVTGGGRCNVTHEAEPIELISHYQPNGKFLHSIFYRFAPEQLVNWFQEHGVPLVREADGRYYPQTYQAHSVITVLKNTCQKLGVRFWLNCPVEIIERAKQNYLLQTASEKHQCRAVILACGNHSFASVTKGLRPYKVAQNLGLSFSEQFGALCALESNCRSSKGKQFVYGELAGLALHDAQVSLNTDKKVFASQRGEVLFTHRGLSGPAVLSLAKDIATAQQKSLVAEIYLDCQPQISTEQLLATFKELCQQQGQKNFQALRFKLPTEIPQRFYTYLLKYLLIDANQKLATAHKKQLALLASALKRLALCDLQLVASSKAMQLVGGVEVKQLQAKTLMCKELPGIFVVGDLLELAGDCGGYNLQLAFSTGYVAGQEASKYLTKKA